MKIKRNYPEREMSLSQAIDDKLSQADYYAGKMETFESKCNNTSKMLAKIIEMLYNNKALTKENVEDLLSYGYEIVE